MALNVKSVANKAKSYNYYYDQLINTEETTFAIYLYDAGYNEVSNSFKKNSRIDRDYKSTDAEEILRGVISQDANMGTQILWNGSPLNLTSAWANIASNLKSTSRNLANTAHQIQNIGTQVGTARTGGGILNWNQDAYYTINEYQKTFGGITTTTPLSVSSPILPYMTYENGTLTYVSVKDQLKKFLDKIYPPESYETSTDDNGVFTKAFKDSWNDLTDSNSDENLLKRIITFVGDTVTTGLNWLSSLADKFSDKIFNDDDKYVITMKPPHGYTGVPTDFIEGQWITGTLALRIGKRQLYNLLVSTVNITVSKELTYYDGSVSPTQAQIDLTFVPVLVLKPTEIKEYVLSDLTPSTNIDTNTTSKKGTLKSKPELKAME